MTSKILLFEGLQGKTAYNLTIPFDYNGEKYLGVRVESVDSEIDSQTFFAQKIDENLWRVDHSFAPLSLQDPTYAKIGSDIYISGVRVFQDEDKIRWQQEIYRGDSLYNLEYLCSGPVGMKDIRLVDLKDRIGVFTRPQGRKGGKGMIGYLEVGTVDELRTFTDDDWYNNAKIIGDLFNDNFWGGVNQAIKLSGGEVGVIGHIAHQTTNRSGDSEKHYYAMSFVFDPETRRFSGFSIIARRNDFPPSPSKRSPKLDDIVFPAGIDEENYLYAGLSDFCVGKKKIEKPF